MKTSVLLVDDEKEYLETLAERMINRGYLVDTADTGIKALKSLEDHKYDAIVMDIMMPGLDGLQTLKRIRVDYPEMQVILLTGHATVSVGVEAVKMGASDFLEKPADIDKLCEVIEKARGKRADIEEEKHDAAVKDAVTRYGV